MLGIRTPAKKTKATEEILGTDRPQAGPSVRRSIGEWEADRVKTAPSLKTPSPQKKTLLSYPPKLKSKATLSKGTNPEKPNQPEDAEVSSPQEPQPVKYLNRTTEAKACLLKAKHQLAGSRNLKKEIKDEITRAVDRLYQLVKESELDKKLPMTASPETEGANRAETHEHPKSTLVEPTELMNQLMANLRQHSQELQECQQHTRALSEQLKETPRFIAGQGPTFAEIAAAPRQPPRMPLHSVVVSSVDENDTSEGVIGKLRVAVDARHEGTRVERLRKARDQKVIVGFTTKEEMVAASERIRKSGGLRVEEVQNKDPLIILKDVLSCHTDGEVTEALLAQNTHLLGDVAVEDRRLAVKYRRRTRNPHMGHIILQVSPAIWQRLTAAGRAHVDLQRVRVADQSPLVQCSICLGYGHGRKFCQDTIPLCSHCGDPHLKADCPVFATGMAPQCRNCLVAKTGKSDHSAFDSAYPVRMKWDSLARESVAYC